MSLQSSHPAYQLRTCAKTHSSIADLTAKVTAKPAITSDFERTKANNKDLLFSVGRCSEASPWSMDGQRKTMKVARTRSTFPRAFFVACAFDPASSLM